MLKRITAVLLMALVLAQPVLAFKFNDGTLNWGDCTHTYDNACDADCNLCGASRPTEGHVYDVTVTAPTCDAAGYTTYVCEICGHKYATKIPATDHTYEITVVEARCDAEGYDLHTCIGCGDSYKDNFTPARTQHGILLGEEFFSCTEPGYANYYCMYCDYSYQETWDAPGHSPVDFPTMYDCQRYTYCQRCDEILVPATDHVYNELREKVDPTCEMDGYARYGCYGCAVYEEVIIPATGHTYTDLCDAACNVCGTTRTPPHQYADPYDPTCDGCGATRAVHPMQAGDVNGDGTVNVRDYGALQQHLNGRDVSISLEAANVNGDSTVNVRDLGLLQQYLNGWEVTLK